MARHRGDDLLTAAQGVLVDGEQIQAHGICWAAQITGRVPVLLAGRQQFLMALTDRRVLVFSRHGRRVPRPNDLVIGKRYETFTLEKVHRRRPLLQVIVRGMNGTRMIFEFRPRRRELGGMLVAHITPRRLLPAAPPVGLSDSAATAEDQTFWGPATRGS